MIFSLLLALPVAFGAGCAEKAAEEDTISNPEIGVVDDSAGFYVRHRRSADYTYYTHRGAESGYTPATYAGSLNRTSDCVAAAGEDIMCYVEAPEFDLYFNGLVLQHNFPTDMCSYAEISLPWYMNRPAGIGPGSVAYTNSTLNGVASIVDGQNSTQGTPFCPFDHSAVPGLPNCCEGEYTLTVSTSVVPAPTGPVAAPVTSEGDWGGRASECAGGPAMDLMPKNLAGFPMSVIHFIKGRGLNDVYEVPSPLSKLTNGNVYAANYFDIPTSRSYAETSLNSDVYFPPGIRQEANPYLSGSSNIAVPGASPAIDVTGFTAYPSATQPFYEYTCYDNFREVKARIRLMVRAWDVTTQLTSGIGTLPAYVRTLGTEGGVGGSNPYHDMAVWGDFFFNYDFRTPIEATASCAGNLYPCQTTYSSYLDGFPLE